MRVESHLVLCVAMAVATFAAPASRASQAEQAKLSPSEISQLRAKANAGDATAQTTLGRAYQDGNGVPHNDALALQWYRKAAEQGDAAAENSLGVMYRLGTGVAQDKEEAVRWYSKAAKHGTGKAMFNLGACYYNGEGVPVDDVTSYAWFLLAQKAGDSAAGEAIHRAESEHPSPVWPRAAYAKIAQMYEAGDDLPKDINEAMKWYRMAADKGDADASVKLATLLLSPGRSPTPQEYEEARDRCEEASKVSSGGAYCVALIYKHGLGVKQDLAKSAEWFGRAAEMGHARAALELGEAYWKGEGVKPDPVKAYMWIWLVYNSKLQGAEQAEEALRKEMSDKQIEQAKHKADEWLRTHRFVVLRRH